MNKSARTALASLAILAGTSANAWDLPIGNQTLQFHGFASQGFLASSDYNYLGHSRSGSFEFNEAGLNVSLSPFKRTRITAQAFTFDVGNVGNYEMLLDFCSIEYTLNDQFGIRAGRVRRPGGIYNHIQDVDLARTAIILPQGMYDPRWRDFSTSIDGGVVFGNFSLGKAGSLSYEGYAGYIHLSNQGGVARLIQNGLPPAPIGGFGGIDPALIAGAQLWWATPLEGLRVGTAGGYLFDFTQNFSVSPPFGGGAMKSVSQIPFGQASIEYQKNGWTFQAEYYTYATSGKTYLAANNFQVSSSEGRPDAWYAGVSKRMNKWFEVGSYYSEYYADVGDRNGSSRAVPSDGFQKDVALSTRFDITDWWILKFEGHYIRGTGQLYNNALNPVRDDNGWWLFAAKTTFSF